MERTLQSPLEASPAGLAADEPIISANALSKTYRSSHGEEINALKDIAFEVNKGEFICIVGRSGCGKSTLLKMLGGLLARTSGVLTLAGRDLNGPGADVGMVFQSPVLMPWRNILDNILMPIEFRRLRRDDYRNRATQLLELVGLNGFERHFPHELSGGMQQRASIVRALIADPQILLMDEPFGALDAMTREQMNLEILRLWHESRKTVIFVTHSITEAIFLADRVFVMTPRPGTLAKVIPIDIPRPRRLNQINTERFGEYAEQLRTLLQANGEIS
jgi:NitT/TauT family transport system ATP-binding protein